MSSQSLDSIGTELAAVGLLSRD